jgi:type IV secretion system protein VirB9
MKHHATIAIMLTALCTLTCKTTNLEPALRYEAGTVEDGTEEAERERALVKTETRYVYVERPVFIPPRETPPPTETGVNSVVTSTAEGTVLPESYSHAARIYDYDKDQVYEVYTQVLRLTDIYLEKGEALLDDPFISDSDRWIIGAGASQDNGSVIQHVYIKPKTAGIEASMIINTDRRVYHLVLRSYNTLYMPMVRWNYHDGGIRHQYADAPPPPQQGETASEALEYIDPRYLSFDYTARYGIFRRKPYWMPARVYDDGKKTYLVFPEQVLQRELPGIFEGNDSIVNYRVLDNIAIIDKLIEKITIRYQNQRITIQKKRA